METKKALSPGKNSFFRSITFRLIIIVASIVLLFGSIGIIIAISNTKKQLTNVIQKQQLAFSEYISSNIDTEIRKSLSFFTSLASEFSRKDFRTDDFSGIGWIKERHIPPNFKYGIILISPDGKRLIAEYPILPGRKQLSFVQSKWFQRAKLADRAIFSKPFKNRVTQEPSIVFAAPVKDTQNKVICVVAGIVGLNQPEFFQDLYTSGSGSGVLVISPEDKLFVASNIQEMVLKPTPEPGVNRLHDMAMKGYRGVGVTINARGVEELSAIASVESTGWFVVVRMSAIEAYLPVKKLSIDLVKYNVLLTFIVIFIITTALVTMLSPLKKAAFSVRKMALGNHPLDKLPVSYKDEVGELIEGFNSLVDTIDERTSKLETTKRELKKRIEEIKQLSGLLPICANCKKIRDNKGYWNNLESYIQKHSDVSFSHGLCKDCSDELYGNENWYINMKKKDR